MQANTAVTLSWDASQSGNDVTYELQYQEGTGQFKKIATTSDTVYTQAALTPGQSYNFRVRAKNWCGVGKWSELKSVFLPTVPGPVRNIITTTSGDGCSLSFEWRAPLENGGSPVTEYIVQVRGSNTNFEQVYEC